MDPSTQPGPSRGEERAGLSEFGSRLGRSAVWNGIASAAAQAGALLMSSLLARTLGKGGFGEWGVVNVTIAAASTIAQLSMAVAATRFVAENRAHDPEKAGRVLGLCSVFTAITGLLVAGLVASQGPLLAGRAVGDPGLSTAFQTAAVAVLFLTVNGYQVGALAGLEDFRILAVLAAATSLASAFLVPAGAALRGLNGAVAGLGVASAIGWAAHHVALRRRCAGAGVRVRLRGAHRELREVADFALPATLSGVLGMLGAWATTVLLARSEGAYAQVALYTAATALRGFIVFLPNVVNRVSLALLVNVRATEERRSYRAAFRHNLWLTSALALAAAAPVVLLAGPLLRIFGSSFADGRPVVVAMAFAAALEVAAQGLYQEIFSSGMMWKGLWIVAARTGVLVAGALLLVERYQALGLALALGASHLAAAALSLGLGTVREALARGRT